jgi:hypothetical protein
MLGHSRLGLREARPFGVGVGLGRLGLRGGRITGPGLPRGVLVRSGHLIGQHIDGDRAGAWIFAAALAGGVAAFTGQAFQLRSDRPQRGECGGAQFPAFARIIRADGAGQIVEAHLQHLLVGDAQASPEGGHPVGVVFVVELDVEVFGGPLGPDHGRGVEFLYPEIDGIDQLLFRMCPVLGGFPGDRGIDQYECVLVVDEVGAPGDGIDDRH